MPCTLSFGLKLKYITLTYIALSNMVHKMAKVMTQEVPINGQTSFNNPFFPPVNGEAR